MDDGSKNSLWVSKKPTERKNGAWSWAARVAISFVAAGATSLTRVESRSTTRSYPRSPGSSDTCCSPTKPVQ